MQTTEELWQKAVEFHGHSCPGLAIGFRLAAEAALFLGLPGRSNDEEILCIAETDACGVDAVQVLLGCSMGKGNLMLRLRGKNAMTFVHRPANRACRVIWNMPKLDAPQNREESIRMILSDEGRKHCSLAEVAPPDLPRAIISRSEPCSTCGENTAEHMLRIVSGQKYCMDCAPNVSRIIP